MADRGRRTSRLGALELGLNALELGLGGGESRDGLGLDALDRLVARAELSLMRGVLLGRELGVATRRLLERRLRAGGCALGLPLSA